MQETVSRSGHLTLARCLQNPPDMNTLTTKQTALLIKFSNDDIVNDHGWESPDACAWNSDLCDSKADAAVFGSLLVAGLLNSNGESCHLTDAGRAALAAILASA